MKLKVSLLVAILLIAGAVSAFAMGGKEVSIEGTLTGLDETSMTVTYLDAKGKEKVATFQIGPETAVKRVDQPSDWLMVARKGLTVQVSAKGKSALAVTVPFYGLETQGRGIRTADPAVIGVEDVRVNRTDSSLVAASEAKDKEGRIVSKVSFVEVAPVEDDAWSLSNSKTVMLGNLHILPGTMKVSLDGKPMTVIDSVDGAGAFAAEAGSSVLLDLSKGIYTLKFDVDVGANFAEADKRLKLSFKKKMYDQTTVETTYLKVAPLACIELNGKKATLAEAIDRANFWQVRANPAGDIIHIDAYLVGMEGVVKSASATRLVATVGGADMTLAVSPGVFFATKAGGPAELAAFKAGTPVLITNEPADEYRVIYVSLKN